jgi:hypothetical protein
MLGFPALFLDFPSLDFFKKYWRYWGVIAAGVPVTTAVWQACRRCKQRLQIFVFLQITKK